LKLPVPGDNKTIQKDFPKLLPLAVCAEHFRFDLPMERGSIAAKLALVKMALSNAQGVPAEKINLKKLPTGELPALVAGPILGAPGTDSKNLEKLLESRAVHLLNVSKATQIKSGVVRQWILGNGRSHDAPPLTRLTQPEVPATIDLPRFAEQVQSAARSVARTNRDSVNNLGDQVLIYYCWQEYQRLFGETPFQWFTEHLIECNKVRLLVLVREDLVPGERAEDFRRSEVHLGASVYHYVRIQK